MLVSSLRVLHKNQTRLGTSTGFWKLCNRAMCSSSSSSILSKPGPPPKTEPVILKQSATTQPPKRFVATQAITASQCIDSFVRETLLSHASLAQFCDEVVRKLHAVRVDSVKDIGRVSEREWIELSFPPGLEVALKNACWGEGDVDYSQEMRWSPHAFPNLMTHPAYAPQDLGRPLPDSAHGCSVALPLWEHVVGYEEGHEKVMNALQVGYPRFYIHPYVSKVFHIAKERLANEDEETWVFPNREIANKCVAFVQSQVGFGAMTKVDPFGGKGEHAVTFGKPIFHVVKKFWQHFGEIISSRQALDLLNETSREETVHYPTGSESKQYIKDRISEYTNQKGDNVHLFATGMGAISRAVQIGQTRCPGNKSVQLGFPYLDVLKVQTVWGPGAHFMPEGCSGCLDKIQKILDRGEKISFCMLEFPGNPLLTVLDLKRLSSMLRAHNVPLFVDETIASFHNVDVTPYADIILTSLTKWFNGAGDVAAGSLVINEHSPMYGELSKLYSRVGGCDTLYDADAVVLAENCEDFPERMARTNFTTQRLIEYLRSHPNVARVYFPSSGGDAKEPGLEMFKTDAEGNQWFGGMFSMDLVHPEVNAIPFYDSIRVNKGPSLGNDFTLLCAYTMLAHYDELEWVESLGISRYLMRVSVGQEDAQDLIERFQNALDHLPKSLAEKKSG